MAAAKSLDEAIKLAEKVLGNKALVKSPRIKPKKLDDDVDKARQKFTLARTVMADEAIKMQTALIVRSTGMLKNAQVYVGVDFRLDKKSKDDRKKIDSAQKIFKDFFDAEEKASKLQEKQFKELEKHLDQLGKYKPCL
jgi:hypothetical protein